MNVQELLLQISTIASVEGEEVAKAEVKINGDEVIQFTLDLSYDKEKNIIYINSVDDTGEEE